MAQLEVSLREGMFRKHEDQLSSLHDIFVIWLGPGMRNLVHYEPRPVWLE